MIRQMPAMNRFWWFALVFNVLGTAWGITWYFLSCPYFGREKVLQSAQCIQGDRLRNALIVSITVMVVDVLGDLFILFISVILIWKIRTTLKQKLALTFTLCLTIVMIIFTISRIGGLRWKGKLDSVWQNLFITIMAEIGLSLVAVSAFRALYVAKSKERHVNKAITSFGWYDKGRSAAWRVITKTTGKVPSTSTDTKDRGNATLQNDIPRGIMTGMRTFVDEHGRTKMYDTMDEEMSVDYASSREPKRSTISSV